MRRCFITRASHRPTALLNVEVWAFPRELAPTPNAVTWADTRARTTTEEAAAHSRAWLVVESVGAADMHAAIAANMAWFARARQCILVAHALRFAGAALAVVAFGTGTFLLACFELAG